MKDLISQYGERMPNLSRSRRMRVMWSSEFTAAETYALIITVREAESDNEGAEIKHILIWIVLKSYNVKKESVRITWVLIGSNRLFKNYFKLCLVVYK